MLTESQRVILAHLTEHGERSINELAKILKRSLGYIAKDLEDLELQGHVERSDATTKQGTRTVFHLPHFDFDPYDVDEDLKPRILSVVEQGGPALASTIAARLNLPTPEVRATCEALRQAGQLAGKKVGSARIYRLPDTDSAVVRHVDPATVRHLESVETRVSREIARAAREPWSPPSFLAFEAAAQAVCGDPSTERPDDRPADPPLDTSLVESTKELPMTPLERLTIHARALHDQAEHLPDLQADLEAKRAEYEQARARVTAALDAQHQLDQLVSIAELIGTGALVRVQAVVHADAPLGVQQVFVELSGEVDATREPAPAEALPTSADVAPVSDEERPADLPDEYVWENLSPSAEQLLRWFESNALPDSWYTPAQVQQATQLARSTVNRELKALVGEKLLVRDNLPSGVGHQYRLVRPVSHA